MNEGFTTWCERLLEEKLRGKATRDMHYIIGRKALIETIEDLKDVPRAQQLVIPYEKNEDPDVCFSDTANCQSSITI